MEENGSQKEGDPSFTRLRHEVAVEVARFLDRLPPDAGPQDFDSLKPAVEDFAASLFGEARPDEERLTYASPGHFARDYAVLLLFNRLHLPAFRAVPVERRALFLPHCLQDRRRCAAEEFPMFTRCVGCGACKIAPLLDLARSFGYRPDLTFVVGGGSVIPGIIAKNDVEAVLGLACFSELASYLEYYRHGGHLLPSQMILLTRWGCRNTDFDLEHAREVLESAGGKPRG